MGTVRISLDDDLLHRIDVRAHQLGLSRSAYLARIAAKDLAAPAAHAARRRAITRARAVFADATPVGDDDSTTLIRRMRDERQALLGTLHSRG
jgi:hypothetical protein